MLAAAAPDVQLVVRPVLPHGVEPGDVDKAAEAQLFRAAETAAVQ